MGWGGILRDFLCYTRSAKPTGLEEGGKGGGGVLIRTPVLPSGYATKYYKSKMTAFFCDIPLTQSFSII